MKATLNSLSSPNGEPTIKRILEWLVVAQGRAIDGEDADRLLSHLLLLRDSPTPPAQRIKILDLLFKQAERVVEAELARLRDISLPVSRKTRLRVKLILDLLKALTQDYFNTLADLFDPKVENTLHTPHLSLRQAMRAISWQIGICHLVAAPPPLGLWQQLHAAFRNARRLGIENFPAPRGGANLQRVYTNILLAAIAQPASFSSVELKFISDYIEQSPLSVELLESPPLDSSTLFWIDLDRDFPAHALIRRAPSADSQVIYFSCAAHASEAARQHAELLKGVPAAALGLADFADTHAGQGVLFRLAALWGQPVKRKFARRRQSYRAKLCWGLDNLWKLIRTPEADVEQSEWMVTNESPDGYAMMHVSGQTVGLRIGDIVALQSLEDQAETPPLLHVCIIRWAISENPEHVELGLELITSRAIAAEIAQAEAQAGKIAALILPETPPLRPNESLVVPSGFLKENLGRIVVMVEEGNLKIREVRTNQLSEQTSAVEVFSVSPDDSA